MPRQMFWTPERLSKALEMSADGFSYAMIGEAFGKSPGAVSDALNRYRDRKPDPTSYLKGYDGAAIGFTMEDARLRRDAIDGSAMLLERILTVFPERRAA